MTGLPPSALDRAGEILTRIRGGLPAVFLDFDGTLAPIASRPELAQLEPASRALVERLARRCPVAVVSGRDLPDLRTRVGLAPLWYAGSHGFEISGPDGSTYSHAPGLEALPALDGAERALRAELAGVDGVLVERKRFAVASHFRLASGDGAARVRRAVDGAAARWPGLRRREGKMVLELQPDVDWGKGRALHWILGSMGLERPEGLPVYLGDDLTDEDAFAAVADRGLGVAVLDAPRRTAARYSLRDPAEVRRFLEILALELEGSG